MRVCTPLHPSDCLLANGFRYYFTPLTGVLFTVPSRYFVRYRSSFVFSLGGWPPQIPTGFYRAPWYLGTQQQPYLRFRLRDCHPLWLPIPRHSTTPFGPVTAEPRNRAKQELWALLHPLGSSPFARRYLGNHICFLFLRVLRCFSSPGSRPAPMAQGAPAQHRSGLPHSETAGSQAA